MSRVRRLHYQGLIWRFRFLMLATLVTAAMTTIGFILGQVAEGAYKWDEDISLEYTSGFMTGRDQKKSRHCLKSIFLMYMKEESLCVSRICTSFTWNGFRLKPFFASDSTASAPKMLLTSKVAKKISCYTKPKLKILGTIRIH